MPVTESIDDFRRTTLDLMKTYPNLEVVVSFGLNGPTGAGRVMKEKCVKNKATVYGMTTLSQAALLTKSSDIVEGITYDPATIDYALAVTASTLPNSKTIEPGFKLEELGKADIGNDKHVIRLHKAPLVNKDNIDPLY